MAMAMRWCWLLLAVLAAACLVSAVHHGGEEDFAFETSATDQVDELLPSPMAAGHVLPTPPPIQRMWGIPDAAASVGKLFHLRIPQDAFSGGIDHYEARGQGNGPLPAWLLFDKSTGLFEGVPSSKDVGEKYLTVRAVGSHAQDWAKDVFSIEVAENKPLPDSTAVQSHGLNHKVECAVGEDATIVKIVMDVKYEQLKPKQRVAAIRNLSGFLALHYSVFQLVPHRSGDELVVGDTVVLAGPGNVKRRASKHASVLQWQVGCDGRLHKPHSMLVAQLKQQASDGTIAEVIGLPVVGWHVETHASKANRERREAGSGYGDDDEYEAYDEEEEGITEAIPETRIVPTMASPVFPGATSVHPHRHHHGDDEVPVIDTSMPEATSVVYQPPSSPVLYGTIISTPVLVPIRPTRIVTTGLAAEPSRAYNEIIPSATPVFTEVAASVSPDISTEEVTEPLPTSSLPSGVNETEEIPMETSSSSSSSDSSSAVTMSESEPITSPPSQSTPQSTSQRTNEEIVIGVKNIRPTVDHRLPKIPVTAGKALRYHIPENAFSDLEDGNTRQLRLMFLNSENRPVPSTSWVQFNPASQEVYALPLEEHVSKWTYIVEARDKDGGTISDSLELLIQHHKGRRTVNFEFSLHFYLEKPFEFPSNVDWQLQVLDGLAELYGNPDSSQITVLNVTNTNPVVFSWTNDSLPRSNCPAKEIEDLKKVLVNEKGEPSVELKEILSPAFRVKMVVHHKLGQCEQRSGITDTRIPDIRAPIRDPQDNYPPVLRNQVDHINATVGELLVFIVPEDTFYDPEDGNTRNLKLTLLTMDRLPIPPSHWLQFDVKNQEFYGIPMASDEGRREYQLVCEDIRGLPANDGLVVVVHAAPRLQYNVEFSMKLGTPYEAFVQSASIKRKFIDKLRELFGDRNASAISLSGVIEGSTIVTWHNRSLPTDICPEHEISKLKQVLMKDDESISDRVGQVLGPEFPVLNIALTPTGTCQGELTVIHTPDGPPPPVDDVQSPSYTDEYLVTYVVPAVIIAAMLILAGIVACVLYRRRRTGKMSVGDEDERQSFRNKGIPVIFQDELEERPDPENKSPVIMKEEKPPLPPPEYRRDELERGTPPPTAAHPLLGDQEDPPYQPPPPFTTSRDTGRQNRPKPTPTYRKPPPYVPP